MALDYSYKLNLPSCYLYISIGKTVDYMNSNRKMRLVSNLEVSHMSSSGRVPMLDPVHPVQQVHQGGGRPERAEPHRAGQAPPPRRLRRPSTLRQGTLLHRILRTDSDVLSQVSTFSVQKNRRNYCRCSR